MRLFVGIPLAPVVTGELSALVRRLSSREDRLRWQPPESWHITLQFLGNTTEQQYGCLVDRLGSVRHAPVRIQLGKLGCFERAGVFFAEVEPAPGLMSLEQRVVAATSACGFAPEARAYHPHLTLARVKGRSGREALQHLQSRIARTPEFSGFAAQSFVLFESVPGRAGSRYEVRQQFVLQRADLSPG